SPEGTLIYRQDATRDGFAYLNLSDVPIWSGALCGAEALRFVATRDRAARDAAVRLLGGLNLLQDVTGVRGLLARDVVPREGPGCPVDEGSSTYHDGAPPYERFRWRADVSKDQYTGALFGYAMALYALPDDPQALAEIRHGIGAIADMLLAN